MKFSHTKAAPTRISASRSRPNSYGNITPAAASSRAREWKQVLSLNNASSSYSQLDRSSGK